MRVCKELLSLLLLTGSRVSKTLRFVVFVLLTGRVRTGRCVSVPDTPLSPFADRIMCVRHSLVTIMTGPIRTGRCASVPDTLQRMVCVLLTGRGASIKGRI